MSGIVRIMYPGQFHRLVLLGDIYAEKWNTTLAIVPSALGEFGMPAVGDSTLASVAAKVASWFASSGANAPSFHSNAKLTGIKLNRIGPDGRYVDPQTMEHTYPTPIAGLDTQGTPAPQLAVVASLRTRLARGAGSKGRMYFPPTSGVRALGSDGRIPAVYVGYFSTSVASFLNDLNATYSLIGKCGVASKVGSGKFEHITEVGVGRVVDTVRSRRSSLAEEYANAPVA